MVYSPFSFFAFLFLFAKFMLVSITNAQVSKNMKISTPTLLPHINFACSVPRQNYLVAQNYSVYRSVLIFVITRLFLLQMM